MKSGTNTSYKQMYIINKHFKHYKLKVKLNTKININGNEDMKTITK